jgi:hypothetical protein
MKTKFTYGLSLILGLALVGCSGDDGGDMDAGPIIPTPTYDAAVDTTPPPVDTTPVDPYVWVVIQDTEQKACTTNGPGTDVDAVALVSAAGTVLGYGKIASANFTANPLGNACENTECSGSNCKYAAISLTFLEESLVSYTEGPPDGFVQSVGDDAGYFSLNAGTLQIQIGDLTGAGPAKQLQSGDYIQVYEVDQTYIASGSAPATCTCLPEHYTVSLQSAAGTVLPLQPVVIDQATNTTCTALTALSTEGCGTTMFMVP